MASSPTRHPTKAANPAITPEQREAMAREDPRAIAFLLRAGGLRAAAEMLRQELLRRREELQPILRPREAVALVGEQQVLDLLAGLAHRFDNLLRLRLLDARIIRPLPDQQRH